ncbi:hypothetical protein DFP73DRAFT_614526 [Morchella snyderi]|nr:hypothetical protein DFP73DRAFT_614526 [Morchella snyderi]
MVYCSFSRAIDSPRHLVLRHARDLLEEDKCSRISTRELDLDSTSLIEHLQAGETKLYCYYAPGLEAAIHKVTATQTIETRKGTNDAEKIDSPALTSVQWFEVVAPRFVLPEGSVHSVYPPQGHGDTVETLPHLVLNDPHLPWERVRDDAEVTEATTDVIVVKKTLFTHLFTTYDKSGKPVVGQVKFDVSRYKYLADVRNINTKGMADAGVEDDGLFSIVISHRVGPLTGERPTSVVVHLVSIEDVEGMTLPITTDYVALCSLHSWTYTCLPPNSMNVFDTFHGIGNTLGVLRPPPEVIGGLEKGGPVAEKVAQRLTDGYSLVRYRTSTGEPTVSLVRGPLSPTATPPPLTKVRTSLSTYGTDLQALDQELGIMDITYCAAWQLGKALALADQAFTVALSRVRLQIYDAAIDRAKAKLLKERGLHMSREDHIRSLPEAMGILNNLPSSALLNGPVNRWRARDAEHTLDLSIAASPDEDGEALFNEHNNHNSSDWMLIFRWVLDKMYLQGVPAHYLITDPTHLPPERLRFFRIDADWVDALIDGALSLANHMERDNDKIRTSIKQAINEYLETVDPVLKYRPQITTYGFLLRSELCTHFPVLMVQAPLPPGERRAPILRHENIGNGVMLCLFDRVPSKREFQLLSFTQPPHQQSFVAGAKLDKDKIETVYKRIYTVSNLSKEEQELRKSPLTEEPVIRRNGDPDPTFLWGDDAEIKTQLFSAWAQDLFDMLTDKMNTPEHKYFADTVPCSALVGIQLNNPIYQLQIKLAHRPELEPLTRDLELFEDTPPAPRTLKLLELRFKNPVKREETRPNPTRVGVPPPHFPSLRIPPFEDDDAGAREPEETSGGGTRAFSIENEPTRAPTITYRVHPADSPNSRIIPMGTQLPQDLIFSIVIDEGSDDSFDMKEIRLKIRLGPTTDLGKNLAENYKGPGATMLSSLRFNMWVKAEEEELTVRLLPRSMQGKVPVSRLKEVSFMLGLATVNDYKGQKEVKVWGTAEEFYEGTPVPVKKKIFLYWGRND